MNQKPTKTAIRAELKRACGRVFKRSFNEISEQIQSICNQRGSVDMKRAWIAALLWSQGFGVSQAEAAAWRMLAEVEG